MRRRDIKTRIQYGVSFKVSKEMLEFYMGGDLIDQRRKEAARNFGISIAENKEWKDHVEKDAITSYLHLYVFTPSELMDYMDAAFKERLQQMAIDSHWTNEQREALMDASERF